MHATPAGLVVRDDDRDVGEKDGAGPFVIPLCGATCVEARIRLLQSSRSLRLALQA